MTSTPTIQSLVFTDDDLKRLKDRVKQYGVDPGIDVCNYIDDPWEIEALLSRLEAAEKALMASLDDDETIEPEDFVEIVEAWRKAAGR